MVLRFLASISLISIYLAMAVGGDVFHKLQHVVVDGVCSGHSAGNTPSCGEETQDTCSHAHAEHKTELSSENEYLLGTSFPGKDNQNNRSSDPPKDRSASGISIANEPSLTDPDRT